jgi:hypothetical protein
VTSDPQPQLEELLTEAETLVGRMPASPGANELSLRLARFRQTIERWNETREPTDEQLQALRDQVVEVLRIARATAPTVRLKRPP